MYSKDKGMILGFVSITNSTLNFCKSFCSVRKYFTFILQWTEKEYDGYEELQVSLLILLTMKLLDETQVNFRILLKYQFIQF